MSVDVLQEKIRQKKNPAMIALGPTPELIPPALLAQARETREQTLPALALAAETYCMELLERLRDLVPAVCFRATAFWAMGGDGTAALCRLLGQAREMGYYVILDAMASIPGSAGDFFAQAVLGGISADGARTELYPCDGVTLNAYCGSDAIRPYLPFLRGEEPKTVSLLLHSANRSSGEVQDLISGDRVVHTAVADLALRWSTDLFGRNGYSQILAVVGAQNGPALEQLRRKYDRLFYVVSGYGMSGNNAKNASYAFDRLGHGAIVSGGSAITGAWRQSEGEDYLAAARQAAERMRKNILNYITVL